MEIKSSMFVNNDENLPQVPPIIYEELKKNFNIDYILGMSDLKSNDEKIGYIREDIELRREVMNFIR